MNGSGKAGNGRGNNRKRPFRRWDKENNAWQEREQSSQGNDASPPRYDTSKGNDNTNRNRIFHKVANNGQRAPGRGPGSENQGRQNRGNPSKKNNLNLWGDKASFVERPKWIPPTMNTEPLPVPTCPWCAKPIRDISSAIADKDTGVPVHFECVTARIASGENLEQGEIIAYIGGGRFGVVSSDDRDPQGRTQEQVQTAGQEGLYWNHDFKIKKVIEWENKEKRAVWRSEISEHYSVT